MRVLGGGGVNQKRLADGEHLKSEDNAAALGVLVAECIYIFLRVPCWRESESFSRVIFDITQTHTTEPLTDEKSMDKKNECLNGSIQNNRNLI
eukprot:GAFH01002646.1.p6 GENE.GAFH01002646.1~~GAFH01002646.1.p6  ORF type:complete len:93 (+),score=5.97 GAFH01002646.1:775-1053(+)